MIIPDNFSYIIPVDEDEMLHSLEKPFCWNCICPCHEDQDNITIVAKQVQNGLFTPQEAIDFVNGKTI